MPESEHERPASPRIEGSPQPPVAPPAASEPGLGAARPAPGPLPSIEIAEAVQGSFRAAWGLLKSEPVPLLLGGILTAFLSGITLGILAGPLAWGFYAMCLERMRQGRPMKVETVFTQFQRFGTSFTTAVLTFLAVAVGMIFLVVPGLYAAVVFMYALPIAYDEKVGAVEAMRLSRERVHASGFWPHAAIIASLAIVGGLFSRIFFGALNLAWYAFALTVVVSAYETYVHQRTVPMPPH